MSSCLLLLFGCLAKLLLHLHFVSGYLKGIELVCFFIMLMHARTFSAAEPSNKLAFSQNRLRFACTRLKQHSIGHTGHVNLRLLFNIIFISLTLTYFVFRG